ncbi:MAG: alpha/beta hydrolase family protein [Candidatus Kariarchaeaceae archaeon]|jgi:dienelactone hydrolase
MSLLDFAKYNHSEPFDIINESPNRDENGITISDISFTNTLGSRVSAYLVIPSGVGPFPAIHFIHWLETEATDSNRTQFLPYALELAQEGYLSIMSDAFWSTTPDDFKKNPVLWWKTEVEFDTELCRNQIIELLRTQDVLLEREDVDKNRIGMVAHDFGAMFGSLLPSINNVYKNFVFMAATTRFSDWFRFGSKLTEEELQSYIREMEFLDPIMNLNHIKNQPILFQFADDDFYVPERKAVEFFEAANEPKEIRWYTAKHGMNEQSFNDMKEWVLDNL